VIFKLNNNAQRIDEYSLMWSGENFAPNGKGLSAVWDFEKLLFNHCSVGD